MEKTNHIDLARLQRPNLPSDLILRPTLLAYLNENIHKSLTMVCAGAGFGKSTLISSWLQNLEYYSAWISIQVADSDLRLFLSHLIATIQAKVPGFGNAIQPLLQTVPLPPVEYLAIELKNELAQLPTPFVLVLDDLHLVDHSSVFPLLQVLLEPPLDPLHLCILSRKELPLPLSRLRSKNRLNEISTHQLRMTHEEIKGFLGNSMNDADCSWVQERAEGWVAGLRLFKLQSSLNQHLRLFKKEEESNIFDSFFTEEILDGFNASCLNALFKISILTQFHPHLLDTLLASPKKENCSGASLIDYLLKENLFVVVLDAEQEWYRFHHLFRDLLQKEFKKRFAPAKQIALHEKAAHWFGENGRVEEALFHAKKAGKPDWAAMLVAKQFHRVLAQDQDHLLENWLSQLPEKSIQKQPLLQIARMWVLKDREAFHLLPKMVETLEQTHPNANEELLAHLHFFRGILLFWGGSLSLAAENLKKTLAKLPLPQYAGILGEARVYYVTTMQMLGRGNEMDTDLENRLLSHNLPTNYRLKLFGAFIFRHLLAGHLERTIYYASKIKQHGENPFLTAWGDYIQGTTYLRQNRFEEATHALEKSLARRYMMDLVAPVDGFSAQLLALHAQGKEEAFQATLQTFREFVRESNRPHFHSWFFSIQTRLALREDNLPQAEQYFQQVELSDDTQNFLFWVEDPRITYCRLLLAQNTVQSLEKAAKWLSSYLKKATNHHLILLTTEIRILLAILENKQNHPKAAVNHLEKAIQLANPGGSLYLFTEVASDIKTLLPKINPTLQTLELFHNLNQQIHSSLGRSRLPHVNEKLTNREMDVLVLMEQRLTNQEIADKLSISVATIKRHAISIYRKLKAKNRREAVLKAIQEGILLLPSKNS